MDLDYLNSRHRNSLMRAGEAASPEARHVHEELARSYARRIALLSDAAGAAATIRPCGIERHGNAGIEPAIAPFAAAPLPER